MTKLTETGELKTYSPQKGTEPDLITRDNIPKGEECFKLVRRTASSRTCYDGVYIRIKNLERFRTYLWDLLEDYDSSDDIETKTGFSISENHADTCCASCGRKVEEGVLTLSLSAGGSYVRLHIGCIPKLIAKTHEAEELQDTDN